MSSSDAPPQDSPSESEPLLTEKRSQEAYIREGEATRRALRDRFTFEPRGEIEVKSRDRVKSWFLTGVRE